MNVRENTLPRISAPRNSSTTTNQTLISPVLEGDVVVEAWLIIKNKAHLNPNESHSGIHNSAGSLNTGGKTKSAVNKEEEMR